MMGKLKPINGVLVKEDGSRLVMLLALLELHSKHPEEYYMKEKYVIFSQLIFCL